MRALEDLPFFTNYSFPSEDWLERAQEIIATGIGHKFLSVFPERFKDEHFEDSARVGAIYVVWAIVVDKLELPRPICLARLESFERIRVKDLRDSHLKGVWGLQFVNQLLAWFDSPGYRSSVYDDESKPINPDDMICLVELSVIDNQVPESLRNLIAELPNLTTSP
jgi:hypothetical protein